MMSFPLIDDLCKAADHAAAAEMQYRREAALRIAALENERAFAFRRLNLMRAVGDAVASRDDARATSRTAFLSPPRKYLLEKKNRAPRIGAPGFVCSPGQSNSKPTLSAAPAA